MQEWLVALIVLIAAFAVARRYAPASVRRWTRLQAAAGARKAGWHSLAARFEAAPARTGSCSDGCDTCGSCGTGAPADGSKANGISVDDLRRTARRR